MNLRMKQKTPTMRPFIGLSVQNKQESEMKPRMKQREKPFAFVYNTALPSDR